MERSWMRRLGFTIYGARYYEPVISVWLSVDPLADQMPAWSAYSYTFNNPVAYKDVEGKIPWPIKGVKAVNKKDYANGAWGLKNTVVRTSTYNEIRNIGTSPHVGIDYRAAIGTEFHSLGDGKVVDIGTQAKGGAKGAKYITVEYGNGDRVSFVHIKSTAEGLKKGDKVYEGQVLGLTGNTGSKHPHLHLTAKDKSGNIIDPENQNYGKYSAEEFFNDYGGDYTKLPSYSGNAGAESKGKSDLGLIVLHNGPKIQK
jgi:RHS repeat-associated protein